MTLEGWMNGKGKAPGTDAKAGQSRPEPRESPVIIPPSKTLFRIHIFLGYGIRRRKRIHGPLDAEKCMVVLGRVLGNPETDRVVLVKVKEGTPGWLE